MCLCLGPLFILFSFISKSVVFVSHRHLFKHFCRYTSPPPSRTFDTPHGSTSAPGSGRTGWWGALPCCSHVRSINSGSLCLWRMTSHLCPVNTWRACRSWGSLPGRPGQLCEDSGCGGEGPPALFPLWLHWWHSVLWPRCRICTSAAAQCHEKETAASSKSVRRKSRRRRDTCKSSSDHSSLPKKNDVEKKKIFQFDSLPGALSVGSILTKGGGFLHGGGGGVKF